MFTVSIVTLGLTAALAVLGLAGVYGLNSPLDDTMFTVALVLWLIGLLTGVASLGGAA